MPGVTLLVLAAGIGRRYGGLKQIDPVGPAGETILDYSLYDALAAGFTRIVFVIRREIEEIFRRTVGRYWESRIAVAYVYQEIEAALPPGFSVPADRAKPWGTAHAVLVGRSAVEGPFAVINADDFYGQDSFRKIGSWLGRKDPTGRPDEHCFVGYRLANTLSDFGHVSRGICRLDKQGYLAEIVERLWIEKHDHGGRARDENGRWIDLPGKTIVSMNLWGFQPSFFDHLDRGFAAFLESSGREIDSEYFIPFAVNELIRTGKARVRYLPTAERWFGVTYPQDLASARSRIQEMIRKGLYPEKIRD